MEMAPKNNFGSIPDSAAEKVDEADLQEIRAVDESLNELSNALDCFEQRTDNIIEQLKELLQSNREIRKQIAQEKAAAESDTTQTPQEITLSQAMDTSEEGVTQHNGNTTIE